MLFCVMVPVLSLHKTVAEPKVSIAEGFLVNTFCWDNLQAPIARKIVRTTGNSSGRMAMADARPDNKEAMKSPLVR